MGRQLHGVIIFVLMNRISNDGGKRRMVRDGDVDVLDLDFVSRQIDAKMALLSPRMVKRVTSPISTSIVIDSATNY